MGPSVLGHVKNCWEMGSIFQGGGPLFFTPCNIKVDLPFGSFSIVGVKLTPFNALTSKRQQTSE